jgi:hypothetical protein
LRNEYANGVVPSAPIIGLPRVRGQLELEEDGGRAYAAPSRAEYNVLGAAYEMAAQRIAFHITAQRIEVLIGRHGK